MLRRGCDSPRPWLIGIVMAALIAQGPTALADPAKPAASPEPHATRLVLLGTAAGPAIRLNRSEPSNLLIVDGTPYLIDVGVGSLHNLVAAGFRAQAIRAVFITHHHIDHDGGLADLIEYSSFGLRRDPVDIVGPAGTTDMVQASIAFSAPSRRIFASEGMVMPPDPTTVYHGKDIHGPGLIYKDQNLEVHAAENSHFREMKPGTPSYGLDRSYAYRVETPSGAVVFTGDTGPSENVEKLAHDADCLVSEIIDVPASIERANAEVATTPESRERLAAHMALEHLTPEELGKLAAKAHVKVLVLTHFAPGNDNETSAEPYIAGVHKYFDGPIIAGRDLLEVDVLQK